MFSRVIRTISCKHSYCSIRSKSVSLTADQYPGLQRGSFAVLDQSDIQTFYNILGPDNVLTCDEDVEAYNTDWMRTVRGQSRCVLKPKSTEQVSEILKYCNDRKLAVCPQGGNTGLVGGSVPVFDEVVISTSLMNNIINIDLDSSTVTAQAGVILEALDTELSKQNLVVPLDLGAKGSCHIGGNVATNAGGLRLLRYGSLHGSVLGLEAVLADGQILDCLTTLKKDNTGYDIKQLFIGSEGTLGLITKIALALPPKPKSVNLSFLGLKSFEDVCKVFRRSKEELGEILSSCEFIDSEGMVCVTGNLSLTNPLPECNFYMLIETSGSNAEHDEEKLNNFLEKMMGEELVCDGTVATAPSKQREIWQLRERIAESLQLDGYCYKYDISLPLSVFYQAVIDMRTRLGDKATRCIGYGHVGDGNLHLNVTTPQYSQEVMSLIEPFIYEWTGKYRGSISAEHGLGFKKRNYIGFSKSSPAVSIMKKIKQELDPNGIMNPYKVLPD